VSGKAILAALVAAAAILIVVEVGMGAFSAESPKIANACAARAPFPGGGLDALAQRIVLDGLDGAACQLHTSREELVLSLDPNSTFGRRWDRKTLENAIRAGLLRAVDEADRRGDIPGFLAPVLRAAVERAPIDKLVEGGFSLNDILG
jgi:hypothetical protein